MKLFHSAQHFLCCLFAPVLILASLAGVCSGLKVSHPEPGLANGPSGAQSALLVRAERPFSVENRQAPLRILVSLTAAGIALSTLAGTVRAFQLAQNRWWPASATFCGICLPLIFYFLRAG